MSYKQLTMKERYQIEALIKEGWSPEQISGRIALDNLRPVSHETIYRYIYHSDIKILAQQASDQMRIKSRMVEVH